MDAFTATQSLIMAPIILSWIATAVMGAAAVGMCSPGHEATSSWQNACR
jgi:hypothetical protein